MSLTIAEILSPELGILSGENRWRLVAGGHADLDHKVFVVGNFAFGVTGSYRPFREFQAAVQSQDCPSFDACIAHAFEWLSSQCSSVTLNVLIMGFDSAAARVRCKSLSSFDSYLPEELQGSNRFASGSGDAAATDFLAAFHSANPSVTADQCADAHLKCYGNISERTECVSPNGMALIVTSSGVRIKKPCLILADGTTYGRTLTAALTAGAVDPSKSGVLMKGSVAPSLTSGFFYTSTTTTITWSWLANQAVYRADGTITHIGAGSQTITGLLANNTYYFYPYFDEVSQTLKFLQASDITIPNITGVLLNGSTQFIQTATSGLHPDPGGSGVYSVELWIKTTTTTSEGLLSFSAPQGSGAETAMQAQVSIGGALGEITFSYANTTPAVKSVTTSGASANDGAWHHVVISFATGGNITIYVDGTSRGSGSSLGAQGTAGANCWWHIGMAHGTTGWPITSTTFLNGSISHVAIYNTALNANQVAAHCQSFVNLGSATYDTAVTNDSPSFYWKLTETSGTTAADSAGSNTGTYQNAPTLNQSSSVITVLGSPAIAWPFTSFLASQGQSAQGRVSLSAGSMSAATPSSGNGGGSGGGSGGGARGGCFSGNTRVKTNRGTLPIENVKPGDLVLTARGTLRRVVRVMRHEVTDSDRYEPVEPGYSPIVKRRGPDGSWLVIDMGEGEMVTLNHSLLDKGQWKRAYEIFKGSIAYSLPVFNLEIEADPDEDHLAPDTESSFALANGWMAHNLMINQK